jgi:ATP-dependent RNA helicase RhlE
MTFSNLGLAQHFLDKLAKLNYEKPYPIQQEAIPAILKGNDILGIAQTGSGKTAGFALPILELIHTQKASKNRHIKVLVLVPTRELAIQVNEVFQEFSSGLVPKIKTMAVYGGVSINPQMIALQGVEVLIATPGRLLELHQNKAFSLSALQILVLDEADKMLNLGFRDEMAQIFSLLPEKRQNLLFSATLSEDLDGIHKNLLKNPLTIKVEEEKQNLDLIKQFAYSISEDKKGPLLRFIIEKENMQQVLVFTSSVHKADTVTEKLNKNGIKAFAIHSKKSQTQRINALTHFKSGKTRVLVATDIIARGIDIQFLPYVINYELPRSPKDFIHRIGRTGRAESSGEAISLVTPEDMHHFKVIQKKMGKIATWIDGNELDLFGGK